MLIVLHQGEVVHVTTAAVPVGTEVQASLDWTRRYDHMQQHTGTVMRML